MNHGRNDLVLGQRMAFAAAALLMGIASYVSLLGMEKGLLAVTFAVLALKSGPEPRLEQRRATDRVCEQHVICGLVCVLERVGLWICLEELQCARVRCHVSRRVFVHPDALQDQTHPVRYLVECRVSLTGSPVYERET